MARRAPISWRELPLFLDWFTLPPVPVGVVEDPLIGSTIAVKIFVDGAAAPYGGGVENPGHVEGTGGK
jgi:hypothetical protein